MIMKKNKRIFLLFLLTVFNVTLFAKEYKSINIPIWKNKINIFHFQNNEFQVSLNFDNWNLNPVILNNQKEIIFNLDDYVEILEITEFDKNKYMFCFSALGFEQYFIYDVINDEIMEPFFDLKKDVSIREKDLEKLVLFGDTWNSDKGITQNQTVSLYLFSTIRQKHYKIAEKKGEGFNIKILDNYKIEYKNQNGDLEQYDYSEWIIPEFYYEASSFLIEGETIYKPENLSSISGLPWATANGYGIGDTIQIKIDYYDNLKLGFYNGFQSKNRPDLYNANSRAKKIKIQNIENGKNKEFVLEDISSMQKLSLEELNIKQRSLINLEITILEVYPGEKYKDLCIQAIIPVY